MYTVLFFLVLFQVDDAPVFEYKGLKNRKEAKPLEVIRYSDSDQKRIQVNAVYRS
jgi:hypothetical protein